MKDYEKNKWSRLRTSLSLQELSLHLKEKEIDNNGNGYSEIEIAEDFCTAIYNERISNSIRSKDYYGNDFEQEVIEFYSVRFSIVPIVSNHYILSLSNPPKSLKPFVDFLSEGLNYKIGISSFQLNVGRFLEDISSAKEVSLIKVKKAKVNSVVISDHAKATIEVTSKYNAIDDIFLLLAGKEFFIDKLQLSCLIDGSQNEIEISKVGSFGSTPEALNLTKRLLFKQVVESI